MLLTVYSHTLLFITGDAQRRKGEYMQKNLDEMLDDIRKFCGETKTILDAIKEYFALKDKVLWTGTAGKGETITVTNLSKYSLIRIRSLYGDAIVDTSTNRVRGIFGDRYGGTDTLCTGLIYANISGDKINLYHCNYIFHYPSSSHSAITQITITEVRGIEPKLPTALQNLIGGGCFVKLKGGGIYASPLYRLAGRYTARYKKHKGEIGQKEKYGLHKDWLCDKSIRTIRDIMHHIWSSCWEISGARQHTGFHKSFRFNNSLYIRMQCKMRPVLRDHERHNECRRRRERIWLAYSKLCRRECYFAELWIFSVIHAIRQSFSNTPCRLELKGVL